MNKLIYSAYHSHQQHIRKIYKTLSYNKCIIEIHKYLEKLCNVYNIQGILHNDLLVGYTFSIEEDKERIYIRTEIVDDLLGDLTVEDEIKKFLELALLQDPMTLDMIRDILKI